MKTIEIVNHAIIVLHILNPNDFSNGVTNIVIYEGFANPSIHTHYFIEKRNYILTSTTKLISPSNKIFRKTERKKVC